MSATGRGAVMIPVKDFTLAKSRLSDALTPEQRATLAEAMATHVVRSQADTPVWICCDDDSVAEWAARIGASVIWCPGTDLNGAVQHGIDTLRDEGITSTAIAHGDLPLATDLTPLLGWPGVTIAPDRHRTGTNVLVLPTDCNFEFAYGSGSFRRHVVEAVRVGRGLKVVHDSDLAWDIDHPDDIDEARDVVHRLLERTPE